MFSKYSTYLFKFMLWTNFLNYKLNEWMNYKLNVYWKTFKYHYFHYIIIMNIIHCFLIFDNKLIIYENVCIEWYLHILHSLSTMYLVLVVYLKYNLRYKYLCIQSETFRVLWKMVKYNCEALINIQNFK